ncbi:hypothetical protein ACFY1L_11985 [Streptomyces sp. NPDC001663]
MLVALLVRGGGRNDRIHTGRAHAPKATAPEATPGAARITHPGPATA